MLKMFLMVDGVKQPIFSINFVDNEPYSVTIKKDGEFECFFNTDTSIMDHPFALNFEDALIIENPEYVALENLIEKGVKNVLKEMLSK